MMSKLTRPPDGLVVPVYYLRARDGDTHEVIGSMTSFMWAFRLKRCWIYELDDKYEHLRAIAIEARREAEALCKLAGDDLRAQVELDADFLREIRAQGKHLNPLNYATFDRVPGVLWLDHKTTLNEKLVEMKLASTTKGGELGA
jgi:hypothetical protein